MALDGFNVVCLEPGADNPKKHAPVPAPEPPEGFVDSTVYRYKLDEDGNKVLIGTMEAFPEGWDHPQQFREKGFQKKKEEVKEMPKKDIDFEAIVARAQEVAAERGISLYKASGIVAQETGLHRTTVYNRAKAMEQIPGPEPVQAANQEPERESQEPAGNSVAQPQRTTYTSTQYQESVEKGGFTADDDYPIPYTVTTVKVNWEEVWPRAQELLAKGMSQVAVAEQLGITIDSLRHKVERERKKKQPSKTVDLDKYKVKWIRDVMLDDLDPGVQLRIVAAVQGMEI